MVFGEEGSDGVGHVLRTRYVSDGIMKKERGTHIP